MKYLLVGLIVLVSLWASHCDRRDGLLVAEVSDDSRRVIVARWNDELPRLEANALADGCRIDRNERLRVVIDRRGEPQVVAVR